MANYQLDFEEMVKNERDIFRFIDRYKTSIRRKMCIENESYYDGSNWTIMHLPDRKYWCDRVMRKADGTPMLDESGRAKLVNAMITNPFVANNRVAYGIFHDIVSQKVNTLLHEIPFIDNESLDKNFMEQFGYALKNSAIEASICGESFIYEDNDGNFTVFDTADCIPFYDNQTGVLRLLIRFFIKQGEFSKRRSTIAEVYSEDGLTVYERTGNIITKVSETPYKFVKQQSVIFSKVKGISLSKLPIAIFRNNEDARSDLTPSIRAKIDVIDAVQSGFINNIEDFSDVFWIIKKMPNGSGMNEDDYADFFANINKTKKLFVEDATPEQFSIPHEARSKAVEMLKQQIAEESGIIDTERLQSTQLTNVAIKASTMKLEQRVSDFEWFANETARFLINIWQEYRSIKFDFTVNFTKLLVVNSVEMIDNIIKVRNDISQKTFLENLKKMGMFIDDVGEELKRLEEERQNSVSLFEEEPTE